MNFVLAWAAQRIEPEKYEEWWYQMNRPLPGTAPAKPSPMTEADDGASFMALHNQVSD